MDGWLEHVSLWKKISNTALALSHRASLHFWHHTAELVGEKSNPIMFSYVECIDVESTS
jgi:hypothetical protein